MPQTMTVDALIKRLWDEFPEMEHDMVTVRQEAIAAMKEVQEHHKRWDEELFSPKGLTMLFPTLRKPNENPAS
jgi:hypothetical protein